MRDENEVRPPRGEPRILLGQAEDVRRGLMARIPGVSIIVAPNTQVWGHYDIVIGDRFTDRDHMVIAFDDASPVDDGLLRAWAADYHRRTGHVHVPINPQGPLYRHMP